MSRRAATAYIVTVLALITVMSLMFSINAAKIRACHLSGGKPMTSFGLMIECDRGPIFMR